MASTDLSSILSASKDLTKHLLNSKPSDLPSVNLSLEQIEAQSRRLVSRHHASGDVDRANYLLAQASVDGSALSQSIAHLNASTTFSSSALQPLQDTDVSAFLRHAHEQNLINTIENGRKETQESFYRMLEDRTAREWEEKKRRLFEQLGANIPVSSGSTSTMATSTTKKQTSSSAPISLQMHTKMLAYDRTIVSLNTARLRGTSFPIVHALIDAAQDNGQIAFMFTVLAKITQEPPALPPLEHASAHILNSPVFERKYAKSYLAATSTPALRKQIATGARQALEEQYLAIIQRTVHSHPSEAQLGGDPSIGNLVRAFCAVRFYRQGEWMSGLELVKGTSVWAQVFFLVRVGEVSEALQVLFRLRDAIDAREPGFTDAFRVWAESAERSLPRPIRDRLQSVYNGHMLQAQTADPFKLALYKLIARLDVGRRSIPSVTTTTEDWLWMQFAMVDESASDENEEGSLATLTKVLLAYGERHFEGSGGQRTGLWPSVLLMCGQFERAVASLWDHPESGGNLQVEAVHLAIALAYHGLLRVSSRAEGSDVGILTLSPVSTGGQPVPSLTLHTLIWRYVRQFVKMDAKEGLQYVYTLPLSSDQPSPPGVGHEQLEAAWELVRRIIVMANGGPMWEELVGGVRSDGTRFPGVIPTHLALLRLSATSDSFPSQSQPLSSSTSFAPSSLQSSDYKSQILLPTASSLLSNDRLPEAIKLYDLAGEYDTVVGCLAQALGNLVASGSATIGLGGAWSAAGDQANRAKELEKTAREILTVYERLGRGTGLGVSGSSTGANAGGKDRDACVKLLKLLEAAERGREGQVERALEILESTSLVPIDVAVTSGREGDVDVIKITRKAEEFTQQHEALQRCLPVYLVMCMDALSGVASKIKSGVGVHAAEAQKHANLAILRKKSRALMVYAGLLKYRMSPEIYGYLARGDVEVAL
ncbi:nucleoporin-interacting protein NIC96 [Rhodocollybia butyracea]|uniref:Nuclear pore protein n=1 Tax=Rhodocollybia butyracea TaxID=206335 RepID=A0A9P5Q986_9AGAR|nr:nucleoporin-interacting protein NIC96 [Rhodocollybia butyracea]